MKGRRQRLDLGAGCTPPPISTLEGGRPPLPECKERLANISITGSSGNNKTKKELFLEVVFNYS